MSEETQTKSERTRAAAAVTKLGIELTRLRPEELDRLDLPERLREEIDVCQKLRPQNRGRQNRLIGQLLRSNDHVEIRERLTSQKQSHQQGVQHEKANESIVQKLIDEGNAAVETLLEQHPEADRQRLRQLARTARAGAEEKKSKRARRELLRAIREMRR